MKRLLNMLGLCMRAGKITSGEKACVQAIRMGSACAVVLDEGAAKNATKSVTDACAYHGVPLVKTPADELGYAIGKPGRMVAAITDPSFADRILELAKAGL
ncbi:MAG: ribosomal L7Ae/L30e/S12e/Gadd45 family protein [Clostridia bacterium]|nr:ribosomal L7Ae/L30e/S12e/Gadd45 family protein [Clostridia bacterium]